MIKKTKVCYKCKQRKYRNEFSLNATKYDGLNTMCRKCCSKYQAEYAQSLKGSSVRLAANKRYWKNQGKKWKLGSKRKKTK